MHDVWITGVGVVSALGSGLEPHASAMINSRTGLTTHNFFNGNPPDPIFCGLIPSAVLAPTIEECVSNRADLILEMAVMQALQSASFSLPLQADIIAGTTLGNMNGGTQYYKRIKDGKSPDISLIQHFLLCAPLIHVTEKLSISGKRWTVASACGSASAAMGHAFHMIRSGESRCVIAGGFEALSPFVVAGFNSLQLISKRECRPFDKNRDGLNPGESAVMLVIEQKEAALKRGAQPFAAISGFGDGLDAYHYTRSHPAGDGLVRAIQKALFSSTTTVNDIDHVHLHGTGTQANDLSEFMALKALFSDTLPALPLCSTKPLTGHTFGASGALNVVFSLLSIRERCVPPTLFLRELDPQFERLNISGRPQKIDRLKTVLCTSMGFGGEAFALVITGVDG